MDWHPRHLDERLLHRIRSEFLEMPGLSLTRSQAGRLWGLDEHTCVAVLEHLVELKFLRRVGITTYVRFESDPTLRRNAIPAARYRCPFCGWEVGLRLPPQQPSGAQFVRCFGCGRVSRQLSAGPSLDGVTERKPDEAR
jgi:hypothetical protein